VSRKLACANDLAIMHADGDWQAVEGVLSKNKTTMSKYIHTWKLELSTTKTVSGVFQSQQQGSWTTGAFKWPSLLQNFLNASWTCRYESNHSMRTGCVRRGLDRNTPLSRRGSIPARHRPSVDPLRYCRQASDSQLLTSWVIPEQETPPC